MDITQINPLGGLSCSEGQVYARAPTSTSASSKFSVSLTTSSNASTINTVTDTTVFGSATVNDTDTYHLIPDSGQAAATR